MHNTSNSSRADYEADLTLLVGEEKREFDVCSKAMARSSAVFKAMLYGSFRESQPIDKTEPWIVELPDDDADGLSVLLDIVHSRFHLVPETVAPDRLHRILIVSHKYDMTQFIRPWATTWASVMIWSHDVPDSLGVAWELGAMDKLSAMVRTLCVKCPVNDLGELILVSDTPVDASGNPDVTIFRFDERLEPPGLLGTSFLGATIFN